MISEFLFWTILFGTTRALQEGRIIGGVDAVAKQFRFATAINIQTATSKFFCSGTLTTSSWTVTSGTCVNDGVLFTVRVGSVSLDDDEAIVVTTSTHVIHSDFDAKSLRADIGLIRFGIPLEFSWDIAFLHPYFFPPEVGEVVTAIGWSQVSDDDTNVLNQLQYVNLTVISNAECKVYYGNQITENMTCVVGSNNEGTCVGDQGGPLVFYDAFWIVGVESFISANGCDTIEPSGYTTVAPYMDWIYFYTD